MTKRQDISQLIRAISKLNEKRTDHIFSLVHGKSMIYGLFHEVYRRCGKKNCKCSEGKLHGPYPALSVNKNGKTKIVMIKGVDETLVVKEAKRYRYFQKTLATIRKMNKEIDTLLAQLKANTTRDYS